MKKFRSITKFEQFTDFLESQIASGVYPPGSKIPSERELSAQYGLSYVTVNKVISTLASRNIVKRRYGSGTFVTSPLLSTNTKTVAAVIDTQKENHPPFPFVLPSYFQQKGFFVTIFEIAQRESLISSLGNFLKQKPKALLADAYSIFPFEILDQVSEETKLVFIHRFEREEKCDASYILLDYEKAGYMAAKRLISIGRRNIAILTFELRPGWTSYLFDKGTEKAFKEHGMKPAVKVFSEKVTAKLEHKYYRELFSSKNRPDAVIALGDCRAVPVFNVLKELKLSVPEDVAIIGFQDSPWASAYDMTSISRNEPLIIEKAYEAVESKENIEVTVDPVMIFRNSCP
ncbi:MAG: GntR family transcriptional regulator [Victivallales bacterium]|jgi:GntR family transcriptional regulator of arabinose operon